VSCCTLVAKSIFREHRSLALLWRLDLQRTGDRIDVPYSINRALHPSSLNNPPSTSYLARFIFRDIARQKITIHNAKRATLKNDLLPSEMRPGYTLSQFSRRESKLKWRRLQTDLQLKPEGGDLETDLHSKRETDSSETDLHSKREMGNSEADPELSGRADTLFRSAHKLVQKFGVEVAVVVRVAENTVVYNSNRNTSWAPPPHAVSNFSFSAHRVIALTLIYHRRKK
jgi:hypothetical protein